MGTNSPAGLVLFFGLIGVMLWIVWLARRRAQFEGVSEASAAEQADLAREARAFYLSPEWKLCNPETPSEFDGTLLSLFDSIETNRDDIDVKLENVRMSLANAGMFERLKNKQKLNLVYTNMAAYLVRPRPGASRMGMQQLLASWGRVGRLVGGDTGPSRVPEAWIRPLAGDSPREPSPAGGVMGPRRAAVNDNVRVLVIALFVSMTASMVVYMFRPDLLATYVFALGLGIFLAVAVALKLQGYLAHRH
jgi:hypothetical protein